MSLLFKILVEVVGSVVLVLVFGAAGDIVLQLVAPWFGFRRRGKRKARLALFRNTEREKRLLRLCKKGSPEDVRRALADGADPNAAAWRGESALHRAAAHNRDPEVIRVLVQAGANVYALDDDGLTPLMRAVMRNTGVVSALLEAIAEIDARVGSDCMAQMATTTLRMALYKWHPDPALVMTLLQAGADVHARDNEGHDVLWHARTLRHGLPDEILRLLEAAERGETDKFEAVPLGARKPRLPLFRNAARGKRLLRLCKKGSPEDVRRALADGADPNAASWGGESALHRAAAHNRDPEVIRVLVQAGANVDARDDDGLTPLMRAAMSNAGVVSALLETGSEVDARAGYSVMTLFPPGYTTLMAILYRRNPDPALVMTLLQAGADVHARDNEGHDVLWHARTLRHGLPDEILRLLRAAGREDTDKLA